MENRFVKYVIKTLCLFLSLIILCLTAGCDRKEPNATSDPLETDIVSSVISSTETSSEPAVVSTEVETTDAPTTVPETELPTEPFEPYITYNEVGKAVIHVCGPADDRPSYLYQFDPYAMPSVYRMAYGDVVEEELRGFSDAILAGHDSFPCTGYDNWLHIRKMMRNVLPISVYVKLGDTNEYDDSLLSDGRYPLTYTIPHKEYLSEVERFRERIAMLLAEADLREGDSDLEKAMKLYTSSSLRLVYDYSMDENDTEHQSAYRAIMGNTGICKEIAGAYAYLLGQAGVDAAVCGGYMAADHEPHGWTIVRIGEKWYHSDVTWQLRDPYQLTFFLHTDLRRKMYGVDLNSFDIGDCGQLRHDDLKMDDDTFTDLFWNVFWYTIDHRNNLLLYYDYFSTDLSDLSVFDSEPLQLVLPQIQTDPEMSD